MSNSSSNMIDSFISKGSEFKGEFSLIGNVKIDGVFQGRIISDGKVIIGSKGIVISDIIAREIIIGGEFRGNIIATDKISVLSSGNLKGNILTTSLSMDEGVRFNGYCKIDSTMFENITINIDVLSNMKLAKNDNNRLIISTIDNKTDDLDNDNLNNKENKVFQD